MPVIAVVGAGGLRNCACVFPLSGNTCTIGRVATFTINRNGGFRWVLSSRSAANCCVRPATSASSLTCIQGIGNPAIVTVTGFLFCFDAVKTGAFLSRGETKVGSCNTTRPHLRDADAALRSLSDANDHLLALVITRGPFGSPTMTLSTMLRNRPCSTTPTVLMRSSASSCG